MTVVLQQRDWYNQGGIKMGMASERERVMELAKSEVEYWREQRRAAKDRAERAMAEFEAASDRYRTAAEFYGLVEERYGVTVTVEPGQLRPGVRLREAAVSAIERMGRATRDEIIAELRAGGFEFGRYPARQLHFALLNSDKVVKERSGAWRSKAVDQTEMPLSDEEGKSAN